ncbi:MAG: polysaccharide deacetylase family protein [bacterium]|nr:polysaccharide deacetylase family protein [bacterium]
MKKLWSNEEIPILAYHRVVPDPCLKSQHEIWVDVKNFRRQMKLLAFRGFNTISLDMLAAAFKGIAQLPKKPIILTFDDGYQDNYLYAFPILKKYNFTATIFLVSGHIGDTNQWDKIPQEKPIKLLSAEEIKEMVEYGISFGAHTVSHPHLPQLTKEEASCEIVQSKKELEEIIGQKITSFCYPYGEFNQTVKRMVIEAGFECACACDTEQTNDIYELRRRLIFPRTNLFGFWRKIQKWYSRYKRYKLKKLVL